VLQRRAGKPLTDGTYGPDQARYILGWAVALRLKRDEAGLKMLSDQYGVGMAKSPLSETFAFVVQSADGNSEEIESIAHGVIEFEGNEEFLRNYRDRLMPPTTAISTEKTLQGEDGAASETGSNIPPPPAPGG
jgi:hypothetical protein